MCSWFNKHLACDLDKSLKLAKPKTEESPFYNSFAIVLYRSSSILHEMQEMALRSHELPAWFLRCPSSTNFSPHYLKYLIPLPALV